MARSTFGGFGGDQVSLDPAGNSGFYKAAANYTTGTFWSASTGGTQYTDLIDPTTSVALAGVSTDAHGHVVPFKGPDGVVEGWLDFGAGRFKVVATDAGTFLPVVTLDARYQTPAGSQAQVNATAKFYAGDKTLYVSPASGSDSNDGRAMGTPLATIQAAASALSSGGKVMVLPGAAQLAASAGTIVLNNAADLVIEGAGPNLTQIVVNGNYDAFQITGTSARVTCKNMWVGSFAARTSGLAFNVTGTSGQHATDITLENIVIQNTAQAAVAQYVDLMSWRRVKYVQSITGATIAGALFRVISCASHDFDRMVVQRTTAANIASDALVLDSDTDTMLMTKCELLNANRGMVLQNSIGGSSTGPRLVRATDCFTEAMTSSGVVITDGRDIRLTNHEAAVNGGSGLDVSGGTATTVKGFLALQNQLHGLYVHGTGVNGCSILGSTASNNSQATNAGYDGCRIEDNTSHVRVIGNRFGDYFFTLTNKQRYGLSIGSVSTDYIVAGENDLFGNATGGLANFSTGTHNAIGTGGNVS